MKLPKPTRRDCVAALVGAIVAAALLAPFRWRVVAAPIGNAPAAYVVDLWTGRARLLLGHDYSTVKPYQNPWKK